MNKDENWYKVNELKNKKYSNAKIAMELGINESSVPAYKAVATRKEKEMGKSENVETEYAFDKYANNNYIIFEKSKINNLNSEQKGQLENILETMFNEKSIKKRGNKKDPDNNGYENGNDPKFKNLPHHEIRKYVLDLYNQGIDKKELGKYFDPSKKYVVAGVITHITKGTYETRGMI
tara:strand:+ start:174 stop:707 length:534 start_codon:yes stop_codon:yes gene_type:complete